MRVTKQLRADARAYYTLTDQLQVQLHALSERGGVRADVSVDFTKMDIEAAVMMVMMQVSKSAQDDLKAVLQQMKSINSQKRKLREVMNASKARAVDIDSAFYLMALAMESHTDQLKRDIDSMSEMGEMANLRLQMAMDRMSKMMSTLSNLLKKISDTASSITQNLK